MSGELISPELVAHALATWDLVEMPLEELDEVGEWRAAELGIELTDEGQEVAVHG